MKTKPSSQALRQMNQIKGTSLEQYFLDLRLELLELCAVSSKEDDFRFLQGRIDILTDIVSQIDGARGLLEKEGVKKPDMNKAF